MFLKDVKSLLEEFEKSKSPFEEDDLMNIDTRDLAEECVVNTEQCLGEAKCKEFMKERLIDCTTSISGPIKKNKLALFSNQYSPRKNLQSEESVLKNNVKHFSQLFIATQNRKGDLGEFFQHENQMIPRSFFKDEVIHQSDKAVFIQSFEKIVPPKNEIPTVDGVVADGSMLVNSAKPSKKDQTFLEYGL